LDKHSKEIIRGENGFLVPVKDVEKLVQAMEQFINHPELIQQMGERSRKIAEEKYDVHKVNEVIMRGMGIF
jgi:glycosyltransferase involved in cell wall biosynthesis